MHLTKDEHTEIVFMAGSESCCEVAMDFKKTGRDADRPRRGRPRTPADEGTTDAVLANIVPYVRRLLGHAVYLVYDYTLGVS